MKEKIFNIIYSAIDEINEQLPKSRNLAKTPQETLFGEGGKLDSLGLVNLIVSVEGFLDDELGESITIADEKAMSLRNSPFRTVQTLADYIQNILSEK